MDELSDFQLSVDVAFVVEEQPQQDVQDPVVEDAFVLEDQPVVDEFVFPQEVPVVEGQVHQLTEFEQHVIDILKGGDFDPFDWEYKNEFGGVDQDLFWAVSRIHNQLDAEGISPENYASVATEWMMGG